MTAKYFELAARLDRTPSPDGYNGQVFRHVTFADLYYDKSLPHLAATWHSLDTGKPVPTSSGAAFPSDNYIASQLHVICNDSDWSEDVGTYRRDVAIDRIRHPLFGAAAANITPCAFWPSEPIEPPEDHRSRPVERADRAEPPRPGDAAGRGSSVFGWRCSARGGFSGGGHAEGPVAGVAGGLLGGQT
ncbi:hypothetical protein [Amycolatopsis sp. SB7-3]|uniref:hypothetical protein n=1 Tax=Amycolatopsis sp. SB7-3 TaxID=3373438 RepID=UPI003741EC99